MACWFDSPIDKEEDESFITNPIEFRTEMLNIYTTRQINLNNRLDSIINNVEKPKLGRNLSQLQTTLILAPMIVIFLLSLKLGLAINGWFDEKKKKWWTD